LVPQRVNLDDLVDAHGVAEMLGLSHPNTVSVYQRRYEDMPKPALDLGKGRVKLWLKPELERWASQRPRGRGRPPGNP
jgi:glutathione-regulated potassium-efflux system ancillary protein KefG